MSNISITQDNIKKRKKFTAIFQKYNFTATDHKICFINIKDDRENLIREHLCYNIAPHQYYLVGSLATGREYTLTAEIIVDANFDNGVNFLNVLIEDIDINLT